MTQLKRESLCYLFATHWDQLQGVPELCPSKQGQQYLSCLAERLAEQPAFNLTLPEGTGDTARTGEVLVNYALFSHLFDIMPRKKEKLTGDRVREAYIRFFPTEVEPALGALRKQAEAFACLPSPENMLEQILFLPPGSFFISFDFRLRNPYISRDDTSFYVIDNPVKKDWVFKVPYIAPGQWKGYLRAALTRLLADWWAGLSEQERAKGEKQGEFVHRRLGLVRLFGNEQGVEVDDRNCDAYLDRVGGPELARRYRADLEKIAPQGHRRGRLMFYPTFFDQLGVEVINPHDRRTGAGTFPIYFETLREGALGRFALLYVPWDRAGKGIRESLEETADDLHRVAKGIVYLFTEFGLGAKTSSGFGLAEAELFADLPGAGEITVRLAGSGEEAIENQRFKALQNQGDLGLVPRALELTKRLAAGGGAGVC